MHTPLDFESKSMIEQTLRRFVHEFYEPNARRARLGSEEVDYRCYWPMLAELGILALPFEEDAGGVCGAASDVADVARILAGGLTLEPLVDAAVVAGTLLASGRDPVLRVSAVAELISGECITVALGGRAALPDDVRWEARGSAVQLSGTLRVVPYAAQADSWLIAATDADGHVLIVRVAPSACDAHVAQYRLMDGRPAADVTLSDVILPEAAIWLDGPEAQAALRRASLHGVSACCAEAVGVMESLLTMTAEYLRTRVQFGVTLANFQALQHRYADMHMAYVESRAIARALAASIDGTDAPQQDWLSFAAASVIGRTSRLVGHEAIQMHGGMGVTDELMASHYNARLIVLVSMMRNWVSPVPQAAAAVASY